MTTCPSCGARTPSTSAWCSQCYASIVGVPADGAASPAYPAGPDEPVVDRFGLVRPDTVASTAGPVATLDPPAWAPAAPGVPATQHAGWAPSYIPTPPVEEPRTGTLSAWGWGSTGYTVIGAILLGAICLFVVPSLLDRNDHLEQETLTRYGIVITLTFYAIVAAIVIQRIFAHRVRLLWTTGKPLVGIAIGLGVGLSLGLLGLGINSAVSGHLTTDPRIALITSEGDAPHIMVAVLLTMIAAPLVEETLFRGLLAESLRPKGMATAIWVSGLAFAAWHLNPAALRYYALMGALFGLLYWKRGLVCSMSAHASFNGVLTVAAIVLALSPGQTINAAGLTFNAPHGWHTGTETQVADGTVLRGPSNALVFLAAVPSPSGRVSADDILTKVSSGELDNDIPSGAKFTHQAPAERRIPAGTIVSIDLTVQGHAGELVWLPSSTQVYVLVLQTNGSSRALRDFNSMLESIRVT